MARHLRRGISRVKQSLSFEPTVMLSGPSKFRQLLWLIVFFLITGSFVHLARADDGKSINGFREAIIKLGPNVDPSEAEAVSETSHHTARELQKKWRVFPFAIVQNFLIHVGARDRGYCFHWAHDIGMELRKLPLKTLELHWAEAYANTHLEHNVVVVTVPGQPIETGYLIDGWRAAGRLLWYPVKKDEYPWKENPVETAWLQNRGPDPLSGLNVTAQQAPVTNPALHKRPGS